MIFIDFNSVSLVSVSVLLLLVWVISGVQKSITINRHIKKNLKLAVLADNNILLLNYNYLSIYT